MSTKLSKADSQCLITQIIFYDFIDMQVKYAEWLWMFKLLVAWLLDLISDLRQFRSNVAFTLDQLLQVILNKVVKSIVLI